MSRCTVCHKPARPAALFCPRCGTAVGASAAGAVTPGQLGSGQPRGASAWGEGRRTPRPIAVATGVAILVLALLMVVWVVAAVRSGDARPHAHAAVRHGQTPSLAITKSEPAPAVDLALPPVPPGSTPAAVDTGPPFPATAPAASARPAAAYVIRVVAGGGKGMTVRRLNGTVEVETGGRTVAHPCTLVYGPQMPAEQTFRGERIRIALASDSAGPAAVHIYRDGRLAKAIDLGGASVDVAFED